MTVKVVLTWCLIFLSQHVFGLWGEDLVVETKVGRIRGVRAENWNYTKFLGIPYARVNETFPFGPTLPVLPFEEVFEAYDDSVRCPQWFEGGYTGTLDCLHVNVHVPDSAGPDNLLPVMIFVYGGRFAIGGAGAYLSGPEYLVRHDVIFVSMGYRVGPYGFMCLEIPEVPGNNGLRDQEKAFEWVKDNIESFGGDVNRMTLFGNSAGAMSVGLHLLSSTEKVYRNAILQSGTSLYRHLLRPRDVTLPLRIAARLGLITVDVYEALNFLATVHPYDLIAADTDSDYNPCVEKIFPGVTPFLPDYPLNLKHDIPGMTIMQGFTSEEQLFSFSEANHLVPNVFNNELTANGRFNFEEETLATAESIARRFYIGDEEIDTNVMWEMVDFLSDFYFVYSAIRLIPRYFEGGAENIYQYLFSYEGGRNYGRLSRRLQVPGVVHGDCIGYLFTMENPAIPDPEGDDHIVIELMSAMWTNFAKYNDPTPETSELLPVKWEPISQGSPEYYMTINTTLTLGTAYQHQRMNFWRLFFETYVEYELGYSYTREYAEEESNPEESNPEESNPEETIPEESIPEESIPEESIPEESNPGGAASLASLNPIVFILLLISLLTSRTCK